MTTTRFAPSPTGRLHLGHAYAALFAAAAGDRFLLRSEDLDAARSRADFEDAIADDLRWLGLTWSTPVLRQSDRAAVYADALARLRAEGLVYPCFCTRGAVRAELDAMFGAPHLAPQGPDGPLYPGVCRRRDPREAAAMIADGAPCAWRLDVAKAAARAGPQTLNVDGTTRAAEPERLGDVALARKDGAAAYHLAVVVDDAAQGVDLVTRGVDLAPAADLHRLLYALLGEAQPHWRHHPLVRDAEGRRLAKRAESVSIHALRADGWTPDDIRARLAELDWPE